MPLNPFFLQGSASEQRLVQDLVNEQLRMFGIEVYYLPREIISRKTVFQEIQSSEFDDNYLIEAYVNTYEGYTGGGDVLTKFGMQLKDELVVTISKERWEDYIAPFLAMGDAYETELAHRPREGDLIYFPLGGRFFEVKFVEHENPFYQLQKNYVYELQCELFEYENEVIDTDIAEIDERTSNVGEIISLKMVGYGNTAVLGVDMTRGYIREIFLNDQGYNYSSTPTVTFSPPISGRTATAVAITTSIGGARSVKEIVLTDAGEGYREPPTVTISGGGGVGAAATVGIESFRQGVSRAIVLSSGDGYTDVPVVTFGSPTFTGATGSAVVSNNIVNSIVLSDGGSNYDPDRKIGVTIDPPTGSGFVQATANTAIGNGKLVSLSVNNAGIGYSVEPAVTIDAPTGVGSTASITATINANENVETLSIASSGQFYVGNPILTIDAPTGIASTATANTTFTSNSGLSTFTYSLTSPGRYYLSQPTLTIKYLALSAGFDATSPKYGTVAWKLINADNDRNLTWNGNQTTIDQEGSVQLYFKAQSSNVGFSTILELNKVSNGGEDVTLGINTLGRVELGIGTVSIASTTGEISAFTPNVGVADSLRPNGSYTITNATGNASGYGAEFDVDVSSDGTPTVTIVSGCTNYYSSETITIADSSLGGGGAPDVVLTVTGITFASVRDDAWHYVYVESKNQFGSQLTSLYLDGNFEDSTSFALAGDKPLITNANLTPPVLKNSYNTGILVDDIYSTNVLSGIGSYVPLSGVSTLGVTTLSSTITYDDFENVIGTEQEISINANIENGEVVSLDNSSTTLTGIVTALISAVIDAPLGVATNFRATGTATISEGFVNSVSIASSGAGYLTTPNVAVSSATGSPSQFTATGRAKINGFGQISEFEILSMGGGYLLAPGVTIDPPLGQTAEGFANVGLDGEIDSVTFTKIGVGYTTPPTVGFSNTIGDRDGESGFSTATGTIVLDNNQNNILRVNMTNPGAGYLGPCTVLVEDPAAIAGNAGVGTFWFNEVVLGEDSLIRARVKNWDQEEGVLQIGQENGKFFVGEKIIGQSSGAIYILDKYMLLSEVPAAGSVQNIDNYDQNDLFEGEADMILDFTEVNPFGEV